MNVLILITLHLIKPFKTRNAGVTFLRFLFYNTTQGLNIK